MFGAFKMKTEEAEGEDVIPKIVSLFDLAQEYVWISSGLNPKIYNNDMIENAFKKAVERGVIFYLLIDGNAKEKLEEVKWLKDLINDLADSRRSIKVRESSDIPHWIVVDGKHFRLEKPHPPNTVGVKNLFVKDVDPVLSRFLIRRFLRMWESASRPSL